MTTVKTDLDKSPAAKVPFAARGDIPRSDVQGAIEYVMEHAGGGGGGSGAPIDGQYLVSASHADLSNERVVGEGTGITWDFSGLGTAVANLDFLGFQDLTDPGADRVLGWDDSEGGFAWFEGGGGLGFEGGFLTITDPDLAAIRNATFAAGDVLYHDGTTLARLPAGTDGQFLRTRGNTGTAPDWQNIPGGGDMLRANNLSDLTSAADARSNLAVYSAAEVDALVTAQDLDFQGDTGGALSIDLDSEALTIAGGTGIDTAGSGNTLTVAIDATVATLSGAQTFTNKSLGLASNTLTGTQAQFDAACSDGDFVFTDDIGASVQAYDADLAAIAALAVTDGNIIVGNGSTWVAESGATARASLGVTIGTDVQAYSSNLDSWAAVNESAYYNSTETDSAIATSVANYTLTSDLASTSAGKGSALIGIQDAGSYFSGSTVESALQYLGDAVAALDQAVVLKGSWDASAGSFPGSGVAQAGWSYVVSADGTVDGIAFVAGDRIVALVDNASTSTYAANWLKLDYSDRVSSVAGRTGAVTIASTDIADSTSLGRNLLTAASASAARSSLGLVIGTDVQAYDVELAALAGLTSAADGLPYFTGSGSAALATLTAFGRSLIDDADATAGRSTLGLGSLATASTINNDNWSGTDLALANGGTGASLTDPNADRILFWDDSGNAVDWLAPSSGIEISGTTLQMTAAQRTSEIVFVIDGGGAVIATGVKGYLPIDFACTITQATLVANTSGSIVIDIWKDTYANFPPLDADSITASAPPTLSAAQKSQDATLTGWTTSVSAGDVLAFNVDSASAVSKVTLTLKVTRTG